MFVCIESLIAAWPTCLATMSGAVLRGYQRLQINVLVSVEGGAKHLVPALWVEEHVELTDDQASDYKSKVCI